MSWVWNDFLSDDYCGLKVGEHELRAKKESHGHFLEDSQHAGSPHLLSVEGPGPG